MPFVKKYLRHKNPLQLMPTLATILFTFKNSSAITSGKKSYLCKTLKATTKKIRHKKKEIKMRNASRSRSSCVWKKKG